MTQHTTTSAESSPTAKGAHEVAPDGVDGPATILHVVDATPGGAEIEAMVADAVAALSAAGHRSIVASTGGPWVHTLARAGAEAVTLPLESRNPFARHAALRRLAGLMRRERVDLVHAWLLGPARRVGPLAKSEGLPFLTTVRTLDWSGSAVKRRRAEAMAQGEPVIAASQFIAERLRQDCGVSDARIRVVYPGLDVGRFHPSRVSAEPIAAQARRWRLDGGLPVIMLPAALVPSKGHATLIDAIAKLGRRNVCCLMVGEGDSREPYGRSLEKRIARVGLGGVIRIVERSDDVPAGYTLADVVVSASIQPEAIAWELVEAQALARPVIGTDHGAAREVVAVGETGWLVPPGDSDALAAALDAALRLSANDRMRLADAAASFAHANFSKERTSARALEIYTEALRSRRQSG